MSGPEIEVALVHRPKYDDWSIPKGKLNPGEHPVMGAVREVREETGHQGIPGRPLDDIHYLKDGVPKRVRFWMMRVAGGEFAPNDEVDQMMWLPPHEAQHHLDAERDRSVVIDIDRQAVSTWPCVLIRHGSAGERASWAGDDRKRPLDGVGKAQANALIPLLSAYDIRRVLSADVVRCLETIGPYAAVRRLAVETEPALSEAGYASQPDVALERLIDLVRTQVPSAVCTQGKAIPGLVRATCDSLAAEPPDDASVRKGGLLVMHLQSGPRGGRDARPTIVAVERSAPLV